jgi:hypothetical protein
MPSTQPLPPKKEVALALLERSSVYVHLDPRRDAVVVPAWLKKQPQLVLQVGLNMPVPIPDLKLDDDGMSCTLSFNRAPFYCVVPWSSVFAMVGDDGRGVVWPDDVPAEVARQAQVRAVDGGAQKEAARPAPVLSAAPSPEKEAKAEVVKPKRPRKRPALAAVSDEASPAPSPKRATAKQVRPERVEKEEVAEVPDGTSPAPPARGRDQVLAPVQAARPAAGAAKKKRELPPYLRVVK